MEKNINNSFSGKWIHSIASNLRRIAVLCLVVALASSVWSLTRKQYWTASAITVVPGGQQSSLGLAGLAGLAGDLLPDQLTGIGSMMGMGSAALDMNLVFQVISSRTVFERIIFKYDLLAGMKVPTMDDALLQFRKRASVFLSPEGFFVISMEADSRENAAAMVNDIIAFSNQELSTIISSRARRSRIAAEEFLSAAEESLLIAQDRMELFREETGLLFPEQQGVLSLDLLGTLETELILAEAELAGVSGTMSSSSTAYLEIARRVAFLRSSMLGKAAGDSLSYFPGLDSMPAMLKEYENIAINLETRRAIYLMLRQELESLKLEEAKDSPTLEILVPAVPSALRSYPKRAKIVIMYTFVALFLSLLWIAVITYVKQLLDDSSTGPFWKNVLSTSKNQLFPGRKRTRGQRRPS
jgi:capsule polysaccharide export protein KpsE/RkpR